MNDMKEFVKPDFQKVISDKVFEIVRAFNKEIDERGIEILEALGWDVKKLEKRSWLNKQVCRIIRYKNITMSYEPRSDIKIQEIAEKIQIRPGHEIFFLADGMLDIVYLEARSPGNFIERFLFGKGGDKVE